MYTKYHKKESLLSVSREISLKENTQKNNWMLSFPVEGRQEGSMLVLQKHRIPLDTWHKFYTRTKLQVKLNVDAQFKFYIFRRQRERLKVMD